MVKGAYQMLAFIPLKSLKSKLILYFLIITIVPSVIISYFYYRVSQHNLEKNMLATSVSELVYSMEMIDKQLTNAGQFSDWIFVNLTLDHILRKNYSKQQFIYDSVIGNFRDFIDFQLINNTAVGVYVSSLLISGKNGMDFRAGGDGAAIDKIALQQKDWFKEGLVLGGKKHWYGIVKNPAAITTTKYILPMVRPILRYNGKYQEIGWHMIGFRIALIGDLLKNYEIKRDETLLVVDSRGFCVYHNNNSYIGRDINKLSYIGAILKQNKPGYLHIKINGKPRVVTFNKSKLAGWSIVKILSTAELNRQKRILLNITLFILLSSFIFTSLLTVYLSSNLTNPLTKLLQQTKAIAAGNFNRDPSIEGEDELGALGKGINEMAVNICSLLNQLIADEQEKRRLELEMLQYQINPHFLYNTLNSLKLMATIQKADGIKEMVTALGRLIMNLSKNSSEKITLEEEISLLNDYVYIQNIRYKGKIKLEYHLENRDLLKCKFIKFTLQPIVENAIFHGIEPKKDAGRIVIHISKTANHLLICVEDDGVGMTEEQIHSVLSTTMPDKSQGLSRIGVKNVDERIKLTYGPGFGLSIESVTGEYTKVYLKIPQEE